MKTIKLPYETDYNIQDLMRQYTIMVKSCLNKLKNDLNEKEIRLYIKSLNNIDDLDTRFIENALVDAKTLLIKDDKIIFRRSNFLKRSKNKIDKEIFKQNKYLPVVNYGEKSKKGNRKFKIDIEENKIIFKLKKDKHIDIFLPKLKKNYHKKLLQLQDLMEDSQIKVSFKIDQKHIYISYEEPKIESIPFKDNRILGLDLNPNNIGYSVLEFSGNEYKIIEKGYINLYKLNKLDLNKKKYASVEVARRGYLFHKKYIKNSFYPKFNLKLELNDWRKLYLKLKTLDLKYRVPFEESVFTVKCNKNILFYIT